MLRPAPPWRAARGYTLIELVIVLAVVAVLGAMATPSLGSLVARHALKDAAHRLQADLALARHEALRTGQTAHLSFHAGASWCYAVSLGQPVDCRQAGRPSALLKRVDNQGQAQVLLLRAEPMALDGRTGQPLQVTPQAVLGTPDGLRLAVRLGALGRASLCSAAGTVSGYTRCVDLPQGGPDTH
jgi:type IV fimbrial biogenesis protein FimT